MARRERLHRCHAGLSGLGRLIGLRMLTAAPDRFGRIVVANTGLPDSKAIKPEVSALLAQDDAKMCRW